jgi:hypothetical protein
MKLLLPPVGRLEVEEILRSGGSRSSGLTVSMQARPCVPVKHRLSVLRRIGAGTRRCDPTGRPGFRGRRCQGQFRYRAFTNQRGVVSWRYVMIES